jgi:hypothetical protein
MLEEKIKEYALVKYAGDESKVAEFVEGFKQGLQKHAGFQPDMFGHTAGERMKSAFLQGELAKGIAGGLGKGIGALAMGIGAAGISHAVSSLSSASLHSKFLQALQSAIASNRILKDADKAKVEQYAETIFKFAPNVATDSNLLSSILANAIHGEGIDPMTIKTLGDLEGRYNDNRSSSGFTPKTYV